MIIDFNQKLRSNFDALSLELTKSSIDALSSLEIIKTLRQDISHIYNLLKIEEELQKKRNKIYIQKYKINSYNFRKIKFSMYLNKIKKVI